MSYDGRIEALIVIPTGGAAMSVTNSGGGPTTVTVPAGSYYFHAAGGVTGLLATIQAQLIASRPPSAGTWTVTMSTGSSGTLQVTITCAGASFSITWTSTNLRDVLGFDSNIVAAVASATGAKQARGVWRPDCPLDLDGDPRMAPPDTDLRESMSPTGDVIGLCGNVRLVHTNLRYTHVPKARYREVGAALENASWETFLSDTQHGEGHAWFQPCAKVQIYNHSGLLVGSDFNGETGTTGWYMRGLQRLATKKSTESWTGSWRIDIPELTTSG